MIWNASVPLKVQYLLGPWLIRSLIPMTWFGRWVVIFIYMHGGVLCVGQIRKGLTICLHIAAWLWPYSTCFSWYSLRGGLGGTIYLCSYAFDWLERIAKGFKDKVVELESWFDKICCMPSFWVSMTSPSKESFLFLFY